MAASSKAELRNARKARKEVEAGEEGGWWIVDGGSGKAERVTGKSVVEFRVFDGCVIPPALSSANVASRVSRNPTPFKPLDV